MDRESSLPLSFVEVYIEETQQGTLTDSAGNFCIKEICGSDLTLHVGLIGYETYHQSLHLDQSQQVQVRLVPVALQLDEVIIQTRKNAGTPLQSVDRLTAQALDIQQGKPLAEMLEALPGVTSLRTGSTVAKPVIHGLHSNRVLIMHHGVRLEGQQWGSEHGPEIDPFLADQVSVVYGASSVRYGSDAIGGVILIDPPALPDSARWTGLLHLLGTDNGRSGIVSGYVQGHPAFLPGLALRVQGTLKRAGNLRTPDYFLDNTGVAEWNGSVDLGYQLGQWKMEGYYSRFQTKIGILSPSHTGNLTDLELAFESPQPLGSDTVGFTYRIGRPYQQITHQLAQLRASRLLGQNANINLSYSFQNNSRNEYDKHRPLGTDPNAPEVPELSFSIQTHIVEGVYEKQLNNGWSMKTGATGMYQDNVLAGRPFIPNFVSVGGGAFVIPHWSRGNWSAEAGIRYDYKWINTARRELGRQINSIRTFQSFSGSLSGAWKPAPGVELLLVGGSAWRSPQVNELFSNGVHHGSAAYELGDSTLVPEQAINTSLQVKAGNRRWQINAQAYHHYILNFIYLEPGTTPILTVRGVFPAFYYRQTNARLAGLDLQTTFTPTDEWEFGLKGSYLYAQNLTRNEPLVLMPANRAEGWILRKWPNLVKGMSIETQLGYQEVLRQNRVPENVDFALPPSAYGLMQARITANFSLAAKPCSLTLKGENLLNTAYRDYLNRFRYFADEPGRMLTLHFLLHF